MKISKNLTRDLKINFLSSIKNLNVVKFSKMKNTELKVGCRKILREILRCVKSRGILQTIILYLGRIIKNYNIDRKKQDWISWLEHKFIKTKGQIINIHFKCWRQRDFYNEENLKKPVNQCMVSKIDQRDWSESKLTDLCNLEEQKDYLLMVEA